MTRRTKRQENEVPSVEEEDGGGGGARCGGRRQAISH